MPPLEVSDLEDWQVCAVTEQILRPIREHPMFDLMDALAAVNAETVFDSAKVALQFQRTLRDRYDLIMREQSLHY